MHKETNLMRVALITCLATTVALAGCSDPKAASEGNFEAAINGWIANDPPCLTIPRSMVTPAEATEDTFPRYVDATPGRSAIAEKNRQTQLAAFDALVDAGLMTVENRTIRVRHGLFDDQRDLPVRAYSLSEEGRSAISVNSERTTLIRASERFCYGVPTVADIVQFTEPADAMGFKASQVTYRYQLRDLPSWASNEKMLAAFPQLVRDTAESLEGRTAVVLTNDGWVHQRAVRP